MIMELKHNSTPGTNKIAAKDIKKLVNTTKNWKNL